MYTQKFKYISCYCLSSAEGGRRYPGKIQIHLMLLFIGRLPGYSGNLDLHLMLLFIAASLLCRPCRPLIQIHLMLLFIHTAIRWPQRPSRIQIHLMLLFIQDKV